MKEENRRRAKEGEAARKQFRGHTPNLLTGGDFARRMRFPLSPFPLLILLLALSGCRASFTELTQTAVSRNPPTPVSTPDPAFAAQRGQTVFNSLAMCNTCHTVNGSPGVLGPDLKGVAARAAAEHPDMTPEEFLRQSIVDVTAFVAEGYRDDLMARNYAETLTSDQITDLVAYMMTLE